METEAARARWTLRRTGQFLVYALFRAVEKLIEWLPITVIARTGRFLGAGAYVFFPSYRRLALDNLGIAFGREKDDRWRRQIAWEHFKSLGANILCGFKLPTMTQAQVAERVTVEGREHAEKVYDAGQPILYAICHLSCWELLTQVPFVICFDLRSASIYQPLSNPFMDAYVKRRREQLGYELFDRSKGFSGPLKLLRDPAKGRGALGVLVDQHAGDKGVWSPFFDRLASTSSLPALMSIRVDAPLIPLAVYNNGLGKWKVVFYPPVDSQEPKTSAEGLTAMMNRAVETMVRRAPENWFWVHDRWKTPEPDFLLSGYRRGVRFSQGYDTARLQSFHVLVRSPNWLGDACMVLPAIRALKRGRVDMAITVLTPSKLAEFWRSIPEVDAVILKESKDTVGAVAARIRSAGKFDVAILFTNSTRSTLEIWRAGVPRRVGYRGSMRSWLLNQIVPEPRPGKPPEHHALRYLRMIEHCGAAVERKQEEKAAARSTVINQRIAMCAGAEYGPAKRWPLDRFAEAARLVSAHWPQVEWILVGAPKEIPMGEELSAALKDVRHQNVVGRTSLADLMDLLKTCHLLLTNDTGTMHLAASLGVPTVSIFGSTEPVLTGPVGPGHVIVRHHVPCSPCFKRECPFGHYDCMKLISAERVAKEVMAQLSRDP